MRTGAIQRKDVHNTHLKPGIDYVEVFPRGCVAEIHIMASIPSDRKTFSAHVAYQGQSPILVEVDAWEQACKEHGIR